MAIGEWREENVWNLGKWAGWAVGGGREHTGALGKPVGLSGCCVSTGSVKAEGDLVAVVTVVGLC